MRLTMCVARIVMGEWGDEVKKILGANNIKTYLEGLYVDDLRWILSSLPRGWRWNQEEKRFSFREDWREEDEKGGLSNAQRMAREVNKLMNSVYPFLKFTVETEEDFSNSRIPTLDMEMFMEDVEGQRRQKINFSFYEKPMKTPFCVMKDSAMSEKSKISILSNDLIRRMLSCSETIPDTERNEIIDKFIDRLLVSKYSSNQITEIIESGLTGYQRKLEAANKLGVSIHRSAESTLEARIHKKLTEKTSWYKRKSTGISQPGQQYSRRRKSKEGVASSPTPVTTVMFVARTPNGELAKRLKLVDTKMSEIMDDKIKFVERAGQKLRHILHRSNPWENVKCSRRGCLVCSNPDNKTFSCNKPNVTYKTYCLHEDCNKKSKKKEESDNETKPVEIPHENKDALPEMDKDKDEDVEAETKNKMQKFYWGESCKTSYWRGLQHSSDYFRKQESSHMWKHVSEAHPGKEPKDIKFGMSVVRQHFSAFSRLIFEAILIFRGGDNVLNSKTEFNRAKVPRLSVMVNEGQQQDSFRKNHPDQEKLEAEIKLLKERNPELSEVQEPAPPPNKKLKRWQLSKKKKRERDQEGVGIGEGVEALGADRLDPQEPEQQSGHLTDGDNVHDDERKDTLNFPIFQFKAKPIKAEVKPKRFKRVNAGKGTRRQGTDDIKRYFMLTGEPADTQSKPRPTEQTKMLVPSQSKHQEEDPAE